jgi:adenylate kinase family enzyme
VQRVLLIGSGGAGKTTLSRQIGAKLHLPVIHLDAHYWHPGWVATPPDEWRLVVQELIARPRWVMDGNYGGTMDLRLAACDTVIFLDLPRLVCLWRVVKRTFRSRGETRPEVAPGNPERLGWEFLAWIWSYPSSRRPKILAKLRTLESKRVVILSSQRDVDRFLQEELQISHTG